MADEITKPINPMATALVARLVSKGLIWASGILAGYGVNISTKDNYSGVSEAIAVEVIALALFVFHWMQANKVNIKFFNLGRKVQSGIVPVTPDKLPASTAPIPAPSAEPTSATTTGVPGIDPTKPAPRMT